MMSSAFSALRSRLRSRTRSANRRRSASGLRSISPVVDVTNYVLLELGQPMHAFDLATLDGDIQVRLSAAGERLVLSYPRFDGARERVPSSFLMRAVEAALGRDVLSPSPGEAEPPTLTVGKRARIGSSTRLD